MAIELTELLDELRAIAHQSIPYNKKLWNIVTIADYLGYSPRHVRDKIITLDDFPARLDIGTGRWRGSEVIEWADNRQVYTPKRGRPRNSTAT